MTTRRDQISVRIAELLDRLGLFQRSRQQADGLNPAQWEALRYVSRANRYSRSPTALTSFLGATKGTVSQTLLALERKRLLSRRRDARDGRAIRLELTPAGLACLAADPLGEVAAAAEGLMPETRQALSDGLTELLTALQRDHDRRPFGICASCRFFHRDGSATEPGGPHRCGLTGEPLAEPETALICAEHQRRAA